MQKPNETVGEPTIEGMLEELAWASIQLTAWERMASAVYAMTQRANATDAVRRASYICILKKRELYDTCQDLLLDIWNSPYRREASNE